MDCEGGEIKEDEIGGECSTHGTEETFKKSFNLKAEEEGLGKQGRIILQWMLKKQEGGMDWLRVVKIGDK